MTFGRYVLTADVTVPAGVSSYAAAGPATVTPGTATAATPAPGQVIASQALAAGDFLLSWTATLQTAAAAGDANNFGLYGGATLLATSVNAGAVGSYPQAAVSYYTGASPTIAVKNIGAGTTGSVYNGSLTVTPLTSGDSKGAVAWAGPGSPAGWSAGPFPVTFLHGTPLWLDTSGPLYGALGAGNLRAWIDGTDNVSHAALSNLQEGAMIKQPAVPSTSTGSNNQVTNDTGQVAYVSCGPGTGTLGHVYVNGSSVSTAAALHGDPPAGRQDQPRVLRRDRGLVLVAVHPGSARHHGAGRPTRPAGTCPWCSPAPGRSPSSTSTA